MCVPVFDFYSQINITQEGLYLIKSLGSHAENPPQDLLGPRLTPHCSVFLSSFQGSFKNSSQCNNFSTHLSRNMSSS